MDARTNRNSKALVFSRCACALLVAAAWAYGVIGSDRAAAQDWRRSIFGIDIGRRDYEAEARRRAEREQVRNELSARMATEFETTVPLLSAESIAGLRAAIDYYQRVVLNGGWPTLPEGTIRLGDSGEHVSLLRQRLAITGDLRVTSSRPWEFDPYLEEAVARFQARHGLRVSGLVDRRTLQALNVPAASRLRQLQINMARLAELEEASRAERYVLVNVPAFELQAVEAGSLVLTSAVVVGKPQRETPVVSTKIIEANFYPFWRVPDSIAAKDLIPQLRKDPTYIDREHFSVLKAWGTEPVNASAIDWHAPEASNYKFRQDPGPWNALGVVRINMPNVHNVYLHDTPLKQLFSQSTRAFSSGCVRVERVLDVVAWLLKDNPDWTPERVQATVNQGLSVDAKLKKPVPVHFVYLSAWARPDGTAVFRPDIYGRDGAAELLAQDEDAASDTSITP